MINYGTKVAAKCFIKQETRFLVDEAGNKLQAKSVVMFQITLFVISAEGDIDHFTGSKMESIYQGDEWYFNFLTGQGKGTKGREKNQSIFSQCVKISYR